MSETVVRGSFWLFLDTIILSVEGWLFWLIVSPLTTPVEVGYATTILGLVTLVTSFLSLGLEYSLLREIGKAKVGVFASAMTFEVVLLAALSPLVFIVGVSIYGAILSNYMILGILYMLFHGAVFISRHSVLGLLESRLVLLFDFFGAMVRVVVGLWLVMQGFGGLGIVSAALVQQILISLGLAVFCYSKVGLKLGKLNELKTLLKLGLSNFPGKISRIAISNLSIILLAAVTSDPATVGVFYIALMMSLLAGGLATSLATMALPTSTISDSDVTDTSLTLGLCLTAPIISALVTTPKFILSLVGHTYATASDSLIILALATIPTTLTLNAVTKLNHKGMLKELTYLGLLQLIVFLAPFPLMVSSYQSFGAALTVLISSIAAGAISFKWLGKSAFRPTIISLIAVAAGWILGVFLRPVPQPLVLVSAILTSTFVVFTLKGLKPKELIRLLKSIRQ